MPRTIAEIIEDITSLWQAWPQAPVEVWHAFLEELAEASALNAKEQAPRPSETRRGRTSTRN
jgi:hypothetical protein